MPKVCVGIVTFNQAGYIRQALDGALGQKTDFPVEIVVHDDCSTDGTREIVEEYLAAHPDRVRAILQDENQFSQGRRILTILLAHMRGEYFAMLDGDDFWQDRRKLQVQADFLDAHPDCALCQTQTLYFNESTRRVERRHPYPERRRNHLTCDDLAAGNFVQTSAVMFRATAVPEFPPAFGALKYGDYPFFALLAQSGWIGYIDEPMATYRIHSNNLWFTRPRRARSAATHEVLQFLAAHLEPDLRRPWIAAANAPLWRSRSAAAVRAAGMWHDLANRVRLTLGMAPR
ncbi:MAG: glycosyltransferase [Proteobacteria bacterium]|nr:glycosyltransferase [Pseudomonadota bacterium]